MPNRVIGRQELYMQKAIKKFSFIFLFPLFMSYFLTFIVPFILALYLSFCKFATVTDAKWIGLQNYQRVFMDDGFINSLWFTAKITAISMITVNVIAFFLASCLSKGKKGTNVYRTIFFMPNLIGGIIVGYIWQLIIDAVLFHFQTTITSDPAYGFAGMILLMNWQYIGYMMVLYIAAIQNIPMDIMDAAKIDGAGRKECLRYITIPMVSPTITICLFLTMTNSFKAFAQNLSLTAGAPSQKTAMVSLDIYNTFYGRVGWEGVGQAKAVLFCIFVAGISGFQLMISKRRERI